MKWLPKVILCLCAGVMLLMVVAVWIRKSWREEAIRSACIQNIRNVQQAVRGHSGMRQINIGATLNPSAIISEDGLTGYMKTPKCPSGGTYSFLSYNPDVGELYCTCSLSKFKKHEPDDYSDW